MPEPNNNANTEKWVPVAMLIIAIGVGLILYFKGGDPTANLRILAGYIALIMVFAFGLLTLYALATGKIDLTYLVSEKDGQASMSRFQLLIFTFVIALSIVLMVVSSPTPKFPVIPNEVLILLGLSASTYAVSKGIQKGAETDQAANKTAADQNANQEAANNLAKGQGAGL
jgi:hypothetical protein